MFTKSKARQVRVQVSLRLCLVFFIPLCTMLAWYANKTHRQQAAVGHIRALGGRVTYDYQADDLLHPRSPAPPPAPRWLIDWLGVDCFASVITVIVEHRSISEDDMREIAKLKSVRFVCLDDTELRPESLNLLFTLRNIEGLSLRECRVDKSKLVQVFQLERLRAVDVSGTGVGDDWLACIPDNCQLNDVCISDNPITDRGLLHLKRCEQLSDIEVGRTNASDEGIRSIRRMFPKAGISFDASYLD